MLPARGPGRRGLVGRRLLGRRFLGRGLARRYVKHPFAVLHHQRYNRLNGDVAGNFHPGLVSDDIAVQAVIPLNGDVAGNFHPGLVSVLLHDFVDHFGRVQRKTFVVNLHLRVDDLAGRLFGLLFGTAIGQQQTDTHQ